MATGYCETFTKAGLICESSRPRTLFVTANNCRRVTTTKPSIWKRGGWESESGYDEFFAPAALDLFHGRSGTHLALHRMPTVMSISTGSLSGPIEFSPDGRRLWSPRPLGRSSSTPSTFGISMPLHLHAWTEASISMKSDASAFGGLELARYPAHDCGSAHSSSWI
jgi:hypothetical protein